MKIETRMFADWFCRLLRIDDRSIESGLSKLTTLYKEFFILHFVIVVFLIGFDDDLESH